MIQKIKNTTAVKEYRHGYSHNSLSQIKQRKRRAKTVKLVNELKIIGATALMVILLIGLVQISSEKVQAQASHQKIFISVEIKQGDTLWAFAEQYAHADYYQTKQEYIDEVCLLNNLRSTTIYSGRTIALPVIQNK